MQLKMPQRQGKAAGFTLIELLVGLAVGSIVLLGVAYSWTTAVRNNAYVLAVTALNNDIRSIMHIVTQDLRRATDPGDGVSPTVEINDSGSCVVFNAHIATPDVVAESDLSIAAGTLRPSGYRLRNGRFQMWYSTTDEAFGTCDEDNANWHTLLQNGDRGIALDSFEIDAAELTRCLDLDNPEDDTDGQCAAGGHNLVELLAIRIGITGTMQFGSQSNTFEFSDVVKIRNDRVIN
jgi:prepilin-type N-terminal cleavage/methylation domain-containing protein